MKWWENRMAAFDCETTSPEPEDARIVTATVALVGGGQEPGAFSVTVNPGVEIPEEAAAIHGVSTERAREVGLDPTVVLPGVVSALMAAVEAGYAVVAFNARYDFTVLDRDCRRHGIEPPEWDELRVIDPMVIDRHSDKYRAGKRRLIEMCEVYRVVLDGAHDAAFDAIAAARLAYRIGKQGRIVRRPPRSSREGEEVRALHEEWALVRDDLDALHQAQRRWAWDQAVELEQYFHQGNPKKDVPPQPDRVVPKEWPVLRLSESTDSHAVGVKTATKEDP